MQLKFRGALTFDTDEALKQAITVIEQKLQANEASILTMEHIQPLGLHVTVHHSGTAVQAQVNYSRDILETLASHAYSGYVDLEVDGNQERFHAKEIAPKEVSVEDIATT